MTNDNIITRTLDQILDDVYHTHTPELEAEFAKRVEDAGFLSQAEARYSALKMVEQRCAISARQADFLNRVLKGNDNG